MFYFSLLSLYKTDCGFVMWIMIKWLIVKELMIYLGPLGPGPVFMRFWPRISADMNIYIVSDGDGTYNTLANLSVIFKKSKKTIYYSIYGSVSEILYYLGDTISSSEELELEIEGLQIINDKIYMGISPKAENQRNRAFIYYIDNGLIHE